MVQLYRYQDSLECDSISLKNTSYLYARYTTSVICAGIVQDSKSPCSVSNEDAPPLCAESCAQNAQSEELIVQTASLCGTPRKDYISQIRADFTVCSLPVNSLSGDCVKGDMNEMDNCGFMGNLPGLCGYCAKSSPNATDSCCVASQVNERCKGLHLPEPTVTGPPLFPTSTSTPTSTPTPAVGKHNLSGGAIAGAVIGAVAGAVLLIVLPCLFFCLRRRRNQAHSASIFNQPTPSISRERKPGGIAVSEASAAGSTPRQSRMIALANQPGDGNSGVPGNRGTMTNEGYEVLMTPRSGGREMRMSAIQGEGMDTRSLRGSGELDRRDSKRDSYGIMGNARYDSGIGGAIESAASGAVIGAALDRERHSQRNSAFLDDDIDDVETARTPRGSQTELMGRLSHHNHQHNDLDSDRDSRRDSNSDIGRDLPSRGYDTTEDAYTTPKRTRGTPPVITKRRQGSLSSTSVLNSDPNLNASAHKRTPSSPSSNPPTTAASGPTTASTNADSSPGNTSSQSEQLSSFKDYYSHALIRPADEVAVLWAYTPRADDEFALERGQMLRVKGIWDDGWATGVMLNDSVEEWENRQGKEDMKGKGKMRDTAEGDIKAFPLVCVCLPRYWRKAVEAEINI